MVAEEEEEGDSKESDSKESDSKEVRPTLEKSVPERVGIQVNLS